MYIGYTRTVPSVRTFCTGTEVAMKGGKGRKKKDFRYCFLTEKLSWDGQVSAEGGAGAEALQRELQEAEAGVECGTRGRG